MNADHSTSEFSGIDKFMRPMYIGTVRGLHIGAWWARTGEPVTHEDIVTILDAVSDDTRELILGTRRFDDACVAALVRVLREENVAELTIEEHSLNDATDAVSGDAPTLFERVMEELAVSGSVRRLSLHGIPLQPRNVTALANALARNHRIKALEMTAMSVVQLEPLYDVIASPTCHLRTLRLIQVDVVETPGCSERLRTAVATATTLKELLVVVHRAHNWWMFTAALAGLCANRSVVDASLVQTALTMHSTREVLRNLITTNSTLEKLHINGEYVDAACADALRHNHTLRVLHARLSVPVLTAIYDALTPRADGTPWNQTLEVVTNAHEYPLLVLALRRNTTRKLLLVASLPEIRYTGLRDALSVVHGYF